MSIHFHSNNHDFIEENSRGVVHNVQAAMGDGDADAGLTYDISGADAGDFSIDTSTGELSFISKPDYESPTDTDSDNVYNIEVTASDGVSTNAVQALTITVTDKIEVSTITGTSTAIVKLADLDGTNGFILNGSDAGDKSSFSVSNAGDVNGDGYGDVIIGAPYGDPNGSNSGESYVVFGASGGFDAAIELSNLDGNDGFVLNGSRKLDQIGHSVSYAGDVNGDGYGDLIIGAVGVNGYDAGESYVVFGASGNFNAVIELSNLDGSNGFKLNGIDSYDYSGKSVSGAGDINGDGYDDLIIAAHNAGHGKKGSAGESYIVFGKSDSFNSVFELSSLDGSNGFTLSGIKGGDWSGRSVAGAGDVNGDGYGDLIIGAIGADHNGALSGASYVVFGQGDGFNTTISLSSLDGTNGYTLKGISSGDQIGKSVSGAGDINGDGYDDIIIGSLRAAPNGKSKAGESYVVFGKGGGFDAAIELSSLDGNNGFIINGIDAKDYSGRSVSAAGDVNGDGFDDLIIGAGQADPNTISSAGESYVLFGKSGGFGAVVELSSIDGSNGFIIHGINTDDNSGRSVSGAGDVNGDGYDDLIVGARHADPNGKNNAGESYVIFGGLSLHTRQIGTDGNDTLIGTQFDDNIQGFAGADSVDGGDGDDVIFGGGGNDTLDGFFGNDTIFGEAGNNRLLGHAGDDYIEGGNDDDTVGGGAGDDYVLGNGGDDQLAGGNDNDTLHGGEGHDKLYGNAGDDSLAGGNTGNDTIEGGTGHDTLHGGTAGRNLLSGGDDNDKITGGASIDTIDGGDGDDTIDGGGGADTITGDAGHDYIDGGDGHDWIDGGAGHDTIFGGDGTHYNNLYGGDGNDLINASSGNYDALYGGSGDDTLISRNGGNDYLTGDDGHDSLTASGNGNFELHGGIGHDTLISHDGDDTLAGGLGNDNVISGKGDDVLRGGSGADTLDAGDGDDNIKGDDGQDSLMAGSGDDTINGGRGNDTIFGSNGADTFVFSPVSGDDKIMDFDIFEGDVIDLSNTNAGYSSIEDLVDNSIAVGGNKGGLWIDLGNGNSLYLHDYARYFLISLIGDDTYEDSFVF